MKHLFSIDTSRSIFSLLILGTLSHFFVDAMIGIWSVYKSLIKLDLGKAGFIVAFSAFLGEGSQVFFGSLSDKGYRYAVMVLGLLLTTANAFLAYFSSYSILFVFCLLSCLGSGAFHPAAVSLIGNLIPAKRSLIMTIFAAGGSLGLATSQMIFLFFYQKHFPWLIALPIFVLVCFFSVTKVNTPFISPPSRPHFKDFWAFFKFSPLRSLYFLQLANQTILWATIFILPDVLKELGYQDWVCYGGGHFCLIIGGALAMLPAGYLADKYSSKQVLIYAVFFSSVFFYSFLFWPLSPTLLLLTLLLLGAALGIVSPLVISTGIFFKPDQPGSVTAFLMGLVWCLSEALGPGGVGLLSHYFDSQAAIKAMAILGSFFLLQIFGVFSLPEKPYIKELSYEKKVL